MQYSTRQIETQSPVYAARWHASVEVCGGTTWSDPASAGPSAVNRQPWHFVVVTGVEIGRRSFLADLDLLSNRFWTIMLFCP